jgi:hypothetical protein
MGSVEAYKKEGPKFMQRLVAKQEARVKDASHRRALLLVTKRLQQRCRSLESAHATTGRRQFIDLRRPVQKLILSICAAQPRLVSVDSSAWVGHSSLELSHQGGTP